MIIMTHKEYLKAIAAINKNYDEIFKHAKQSNGDMYLAILKEKNERLADLADLYHNHNYNKTIK